MEEFICCCILMVHFKNNEKGAVGVPSLSLCYHFLLQSCLRQRYGFCSLSSVPAKGPTAMSKLPQWHTGHPKAGTFLRMSESYSWIIAYWDTQLLSIYGYCCGVANICELLMGYGVSMEDFVYSGNILVGIIWGSVLSFHCLRWTIPVLLSFWICKGG